MKKIALLIAIFTISYIKSAEIASLQKIAMQYIAQTTYKAIQEGNLAYIEQLPFHVWNNTTEDLCKQILLNQPLSLFDHTFTASLIDQPLEYVYQHDIISHQVSPDGCYIAFGHVNGTLTLFDVNKKTFINIVLFTDDEIEDLEWDHHSQNILVRTSTGLCGIYNIFHATYYDLHEENSFIKHCFWVKKSTMIYFLMEIKNAQQLTAINIADLTDDNKNKYCITEKSFSKEININIRRNKDYVIYNYGNNFIIFNLSSGEFAETSIDLPQNSTRKLSYTSFNQHNNTFFVRFKNEPLNYLLSLNTLKVTSFPGNFEPLAWESESIMIHGTHDKLQFIEISTGKINSEVNFSNTSELAGQSESDFFALVQPEERSYSLEIIRPGMKKSIRLYNFQNNNFNVFFTKKMAQTYITQRISNIKKRILVYDTSLLFGVALTLKQIILLEFMLLHTKQAVTVSQLDFWKDTFESLPQKIKDVFNERSKSKSCTII